MSLAIPHFGATPPRDFDFPDLPDALCRQVDPDLFYPEVGDTTALAKWVCRRCPVTVECLKWALDHDERFGVWAATTPRQRRAILKQRAAALQKGAAA